MLPTSHPVPILGHEGVLQDPAALATAFVEFSAAAARLEDSYRRLQGEVVQLRATLAERNRALRESRAENSQMKLTLGRILDALPCGVMVGDEQQRISLINPEARRLLGVEREAVRHWSEVPASARERLSVALQPDGPDGEQDVCIADGSERRWLAVRVSSVMAGARGDRQSIVILRDATAQKNLEEEREKARNVVALAEMSTVLAHEIRNPLASLELFAGLIGEEGEGTGEYVAHLQAGIRSLGATVNNVLRFHGCGGLQLSPINLGEALGRAVEFVRPLAAERQIDIALTDANPDITVRGDENALQQVFLNLSLNAFRHTAPGGWLRITSRRVARDGQTVARLEFSDNGCGIAADALPNIFEAGFSAGGQTPGLGLAVCRRIVERHGGTIMARSVVGRGTTFSLELAIAS